MFNVAPQVVKLPRNEPLQSFYELSIHVIIQTAFEMEMSQRPDACDDPDLTTSLTTMLEKFATPADPLGVLQE